MLYHQCAHAEVGTVHIINSPQANVDLNIIMNLLRSKPNCFNSVIAIATIVKSS